MFEEVMVRERKSAKHEKTYVDAGFWYFSSPKFDSVRTIDIDCQLTDLLRRERNNQKNAEAYFADRYKRRVFTVPLVIAQYIEKYCLRNGLRRDELLFPLTERAIQKQLAIVCDYLGYEGISTHSFRKWYATEIYKNNGYDIALVQRLLQHSSAAVHSAVYRH